MEHACVDASCRGGGPRGVSDVYMDPKTEISLFRCRQGASRARGFPIPEIECCLTSGNPTDAVLGSSR